MGIAQSEKRGERGISVSALATDVLLSYSYSRLDSSAIIIIVYNRLLRLLYDECFIDVGGVCSPCLARV
jgi:hypothetical protein